MSETKLQNPIKIKVNKALARAQNDNSKEGNIKKLLLYNAFLDIITLHEKGTIDSLRDVCHYLQEAVENKEKYYESA